VVVYVFAQHRDPGVIQVVFGVHARNLCDQVLGRGVFHFGLVKQRVVVDGCADLGVEDFLFNLRVHRQFLADLVGDFALVFGGRVAVTQLFVSREKLFDGDVVCVEQVDGIMFFRGCFAHGVPLGVGPRFIGSINESGS
jgi:hypothetical protein